MATLKMKKLRLIGLLEEKDKLIDVLCGIGGVEVVKPPVIEHTKDMEVREEQRNDLTAKLTRVFNAINFVGEQTRERLTIAKKAKDKSVKKPPSIFLGGKALVDTKDFYAVAQKEKEIFDTVVAPCEQMSARVKELNSLITALETQTAALEVYKDVDVEASSLKATEYSVVGLGSVKKQDVVEKLSAAHPSAQFTVVGTLVNKKNKPEAFAVLYACVPADAEAVKKSLAETDFTPAVFDFRITPKAWYKELAELLGKYKAERFELTNSAFALNAKMHETKILYDLLGLELQKAELVSKMSFTDTVFVLDGWIAEANEKNVLKAIETATPNLEVEVSEAEAEDKIPTLQKHNKFVDPHSMITNMYSTPDAREIDPSPIMSFFYMFLFGIMLADAIYGLVLAAACFLILKKAKPTGGGKRLIQVVMFGGLAAVFWGIIFGSYMGFGYGTEGLGKAQLAWLPPTLLLNPMSYPLEMLLLSVILGAVHMCFGLGIKFAQNVKNKDVVSAIGGSIPWIVFLAGVIIAALSMILNNPFNVVDLPIGRLSESTSGSMMTVGLIMLGVGAGMLFLLTGLKKLLQGKVMGYITGGLGGLYGIIAYLSDLLSYARLFGLALCGGVIAMVFNILGGLMMGSVFSAPIGIVIILFGFVFNLALSVLGVYVHDSRLQYIEFFGKFLQGEGRLFKPLGTETKYVEITGTSLQKDLAEKK